MLKRNIIITSFLLLLILCMETNNCESFSLEILNQEQIQTYYEEKEKQDSINEPYIGILEIPSIELKRGFFKENSPLNNVDLNIELISECNPNQACDFILASHSGNSAIAFFKNLDQLNINDIALLDYQHEKYTYHLSQIQNQQKNGMISLEKTNLSRLVLTTCDKQNQSIQKVYIFEKEEA